MCLYFITSSRIQVLKKSANLSFRQRGNVQRTRQPHDGLTKLWTDFNSYSNFALIWYGTCGSRHAQTNSLLLALIPHGTPQTLFYSGFSSFCRSFLYFVLPVRAPASSHVFLCMLQVCLWPLSAVCRPWDGSSTCADDSFTLDRLWRYTIPSTVHLSPV